MALRQATDIRLRQGFSNGKQGKRDDLGGMYFRSSWEANIARYLNFLIKHGKLYKWEYERQTFWFQAIKRGTRSYTPDFKLWDNPESEPYFWEVKGWDHPRGKTARERMARYYPNVRIVLIDEGQYKAIKKSSALIEGWE